MPNILQSISQKSTTNISTSPPIPTVSQFNPFSNQVKLDFGKGDFDKMQKDADLLLTYASSDNFKRALNQ